MYENLIESIKKISERLKENDLKYSEIFSKGGVNLASYGWYVGANIPLIKALDAMSHAKHDEKSEIDKIFIKYY